MTDKPAFPPHGDTFEFVGVETGMSLHDWFAGQALISLATQHHGNDWGQSGVGHGPMCASKAYAIADAMLAEREKRNAK